MKKVLLTVALIAIASSAWAQAGTRIIPAELQDKIIAETLTKFWGTAQDSKGRPFQPVDEQDRKTLPIDQETAHKILDFSGYSGVAQWCGLDWRERYTQYMKLTRWKMPTEKAQAFSALLHAVGQQMVLVSQKDKACPAKTRANIEQVFATEVSQLKELNKKSEKNKKAK